MATLATTAAVLPVFLFGGLSSLVQNEVAMGPSLVGASTGAFFGAAALSSIPAGRLAEAVGETRSLVLGILLATGSLLGLGLLANTPLQFMMFLVVGGISNGVIQPAANLTLSRRVAQRVQGIAFGIKQAAIPIATLLAGAAVPTLGLSIGWR